MEHESFVPVPSARVAAALRTPGAVAAALPGWQPDAGAEAAERVAHGRLRFRAGGSTITYRGFVAVEGDASPYTLVAKGTEVRGEGVAEVNLRVTLTATERPEPGTVLTYEGTAQAGGRLAGYDPAVVAAAAGRLLDRFTAALAERAPEAEEPTAAPAAPTDPAPGTGPVEAAQADAGAASEAAEAVPDEAQAEGQDEDRHADRHADRDGDADELRGWDSGEAVSDGDEDREGDIAEAAASDTRRGAGEAREPREAREAGAAEGPEGRDESDVVDDLGDPGELEEFELVEVELEVPESAAALDDLVPAEAAHARRTMIGRSAEEVDHAPPRGRYAPTPAPDAGSAVATLRWAAPAAAALLASAVVVGRVLRRRR
ncbi:SRPBCC domain-containing protein [Actinacidiphila yeochonensis]|uniref:SRPBCC domain-containing protein n=1 Tax=Actinacidiphila yeochonensis TaxID=89050 RepID=UPI000563A777|nr:SRPBCC domain-containing protein [Actinacidiphila yeochonensis]